MRGTQPVVLPATSTTRVSRVCSPAPLTVAVVVLPLTSTGSPPSILYSTRATPEVASVPCTVTSSEGAVEPRGGDGGVVARQDRVDADRLDLPARGCVPSPSVRRVRSVCTPSPLTVTTTGPAPGTTAERASSTSSHSICVTPLPPASVPDTLTSTDGVVTQPAGTVVVSTGPAESTCTMWVVHADYVARDVDDARPQRVRAVRGDVERCRRRRPRSGRCRRARRPCARRRTGRRRRCRRA